MRFQKRELWMVCTAIWVGNGFAQTNPNILIIHTDEHNFRTLGCYRECLPESQAMPWGVGNVVETPHIDYLAHHGILFTRCYATTPVSSPSRASFMSGLYPQNAGVLTNDMVLNKEAVTFGEVLRENGYETGYIGKLHLNGKGRPEWHPARDFGFTDNRYMYNRGHWKKIEETGKGPDFIKNADVKTTDSLSFPTDYLTNRAIEFIKQHKTGPFCCMVCFPDPHSANLVRPPYDTMYSSMKFQTPLTSKKDTAGLPAWSHGENLRGDRMEDMAQYFGMVKCIDDNIGRLLQVLEENKILDNTIVIFTSDHGDLCGEHGLINKGLPLDGSARVPFVISYPKGMPQGIVVKNVMSVVDFTPSLLSYCNIESSFTYEGRDLSPLWRGGKLPARMEDAVFMRATTPVIAGDWDESATAKRTNWVSIVTSRYKLTFSEYPSDSPWLTDLEKDPDELVNCYNDPDYRSVVEKLKKQVWNYGKQHNDPRVISPKIKKELLE